MTCFSPPITDYEAGLQNVLENEEYGEESGGQIVQTGRGSFVCFLQKTEPSLTKFNAEGIL